MTPDTLRLHQRAQAAVSQILSGEAALLEVLMEMERRKSYLPMGFDSLFAYCVHALGLTEAQSYTYIAVARKSREVPELKEAVENKELTLSNAKRLVSVINPENKESWLEKGKTLSQKALEKEIVKENPGPPVVEKIRAVSENESELRVGLDADMEKKLARVKALIGTSSAKEALNHLLNDYLKRCDPVEKAKKPRQLCARTVAKVDSRYIPRQVFHAVQQRDKGLCQFKAADGRKCLSDKWVEVHHLKPWAWGGTHQAENLLTLCSRHHHYWHRGTGS